MTPLRIALLTHSTNPRGGVSHCLSLAEALTALGHEAVVHAPDPARRGFYREARCGTVAIPACRVESRSTADLVEQRIAEFWDWLSVPYRRGFDVYHAHDGIGANALADLAEAGLIPGFVRTVHHLDDFAEPQIAARQDRGVTAAETVLCVSDEWRDRLRQQYGIAATRVTNGVDGSVYADAVTAIDANVRRIYGIGQGGRPLVLAVGGFEARKNSLRIVEAFARLRARHASAQLVIAGGASVLDHAAYARLCADTLRDLGLRTGPGEAVVVTGPVPQEHMPALYRVADVLAFPSLAEGFGLAVIEAMACGTPVIVSRIPPFTEYLLPEDAFWAEPTDVASIAQAMAAALDGSDRAARISRGHAVASRFSWASSAETHLGHYAGHLARRRAPMRRDIDGRTAAHA